MIDQEKLKNIEELHRLKTEGILTEAEFDKAKADLLSGSRPVATARTASVIQPREPAGPIVLPEKGDHFAWATLPLKRYADFTGRSTRREYWMFLALLNAVMAFLAIVVLSDAMSRYEFEGPGFLAMFSMAAMLAVLLGSIVPLLAVEARRFHDQDYSGWLVLLNIIPYAGVLIILILMLGKGTEGENRFGPDPLAPEA